MQKLRRVVLEKMIAADLTALQIDMMIYLSRYQDDHGCITGVHYRHACESIGMSTQSFYNALSALQDAGLIAVTKTDRADVNVRILDNDCSVYQEIGQYINTNRQMFYSKEFRALRAPAKLLAMYLLRRTGENNGGFQQTWNHFVKKYTKLLSITKRMLCEYLHDIKVFFLLGKKEGMYYVTVRRHAANPDKTSEQDRQRLHTVKAICRRLGILQTPADAVSDTAGLLSQYHKDVTFEIISEAVRDSLLIQGFGTMPKRAERTLAPKLLHKVLRGLLHLAPSYMPAYTTKA